MDKTTPTWFDAALALIWSAAGVVVFLPFAVGTSPLDAVMLRVPGNQGNWWHVLVGAPFLLAFPMMWLRLRALFSDKLSSLSGRREIWAAVGLSLCGTILVETPFLLHLAGTSEWQRVAVLSLGFGIIVISGALLVVRRLEISPNSACLVGLNTAYLANGLLCLIVYGDAAGPPSSRIGWFVTMAIVWPMLLELGWIFVQAFHIRPRVAGR